MTSEVSSFKITLEDQSATEAFGTSLAEIANPQDILLLNGNLGSGKSIIARAFIRAYCQTNEEIPSPTFTLLQTYDSGPFTVFHFDLYRVNTVEETFELGIEEAFGDGISLIEWPDRLGGQLPNDRLEINIVVGKKLTSREVILKGYGYWTDRLKHSFGNKLINV